MEMGEAWIIDAVRTPRGKGRKDVGALVQTHPQELMATTLRALAARNALDPHDVDDVVVGCVSQAGDQGACIARNAVLLAQWPQEVTGISLNRFCGSGLQGVNFAFMGVMSGQQQLVVGGGVESMSRQPIGSDGAGLDGNNPDLRELHPIVPLSSSGCSVPPVLSRIRPGDTPGAMVPGRSECQWLTGIPSARALVGDGGHG
jgi:acetyl-CoA C-acetyltransferase